LIFIPIHCPRASTGFLGGFGGFGAFFLCVGFAKASRRVKSASPTGVGARTLRMPHPVATSGTSKKKKYNTKKAS